MINESHSVVSILHNYLWITVCFFVTGLRRETRTGFFKYQGTRDQVPSTKDEVQFH